MKDFIHVLGVLSRDMMVSRGHFLMVRNLDGGAQSETRAPQQGRAQDRPAATPAEGGPAGTTCAR